MKTKLSLITMALLTLFSSSVSAAPMGTAFTYQGRLQDGPNPANGIYDFQFALYAAASSGTVVSGVLTNSAIGVSNGLFMVALDFGPDVFTGEVRWLDIGVRTNGGGPFVALAPRLPITAAPYALNAASFLGPVDDTQLSGNIARLSASQAFTGTVTFNPAAGAPFIIPTQFTNVVVTNLNAGNADTVDGLHASDFWQLRGNNLVPGDFLGALNNQPLELRVNNTRGWLLDGGVTAPNLIGGFNGNAAVGGVSGVTIAGGGSAGNVNVAASDFAVIGGGAANFIAPQSGYSTIGGGQNNGVQFGDLNATIAGGVNNTILSNNWYSAIGGGGQNTISNNAWYSLVDGGGGNTIGAYSWWSVIGGGAGNTIFTNNWYSTIGGGDMNAIQNNTRQATIGGGTSNLVQNNADGAVIGGGILNSIGSYAGSSSIGGGYGNVAQGGATMSTIAGGNANRIESGAQDDTIGGGMGNIIRSNKLGSTIGGGGLNLINAKYATIPGGANNLVSGDYGFAAGQNAQALHPGVFVWADSTPGLFASTANDQFMVRASGGVGIGKAPAAGMALDVNGTVIATFFSGTFQGDGSALTGIVGNSIASGAVVKSLNGLTDGVVLAAGANVTLATNGNTLTLSAGGGGAGGWSLTGNAGITPPVNFLGTTDNNPLELCVNTGRAFRLEPTLNSPNIIGGFKYNSVLNGLYGVTIAGGGETFYTNRVSANVATVGGGSGHRIDLNSGASTIAGGGINTIRSNTYAATIAGGYLNTVGTNAQYAAVGGGDHNTGNGPQSTIAGGDYNTTAGNYSTVGGGTTDAANNYAATVAGGYINTASGQYSVVSGGQQNTASGDNSVIPGGSLNTAAGTNSFAAGSQAQAINSGTFVWADAQVGPFTSTANNQVSFRCLGGVRFTSGLAGGNQTVSWVPGASSWSFSSDRSLKEGFVLVDTRSVPERVLQLPLSEWNYIGYSQRHIGPMAQDFHALFPLNESDTTLNEADLHGVALAAIQGLNQKVESENAALRAENIELKVRLERLEQLINAQSGGAK